MPNLLMYLQHYFSPSITYYEGNGLSQRKDLEKPSVKQCWTDGSIDAETLGKFQLGYSPDFRTYGYDLMPPQMDNRRRSRNLLGSDHPAVQAMSKSLEVAGISKKNNDSKESEEGEALTVAASLAQSSGKHKSHRHLSSEVSYLGAERLMAKDIEFFPTCPI